MDITLTQSDNISIFTLSGELDVYHADAVRAHLFNGPPLNRVVVDMGSITFIDSTGLALLVQALKQARSAGGDLRLCNVATPVMTILQLTRLDRALSIYPDVDAALASFAD